MIEIMDFDSSDEVNWEKFHTFVSYKARNQGGQGAKGGRPCAVSGCAAQGEINAGIVGWGQGSRAQGRAIGERGGQGRQGQHWL